ncbi:MAG TPA: hypothetical protein VE988_30185 [Gemmataceae bacterium]|nr:hypothetical protein [Gemmataceae bacterium]
MFRNRITMYEQENNPLPQNHAQGFNPCAFSMMAVSACCPQQSAVQQWIYQQAFQAAQACVRPSILERDLLGVWN